jgi:hypothetical protein
MNSFKLNWLSNNGVEVSEETRESWANTGVRRLVNNLSKDSPFRFFVSGNSLVVAFKCGDEIEVYDTIIRRKANIILKEQDLTEQESLKAMLKEAENEINILMTERDEALKENEKLRTICRIKLGSVRWE